MTANSPRSSLAPFLGLRDRRGGGCIRSGKFGETPRRSQGAATRARARAGLASKLITKLLISIVLESRNAAIRLPSRSEARESGSHAISPSRM